MRGIRPGQVVASADADALAERVARDVLEALAARQASGATPSLVLTGGTVARTIHAAMVRAETPLDWSRVDVWWGDERYVASADPERNAGQASEDLLGRVPVSARRVHPMPASDGEHADVAAAASAYSRELERFVSERGASHGDGEPWFDVLMLGIGPDGHCASLFPGRAELREPGLALPVTGAPKPPPTRITLSLETLGHARAVAFVATGAGKAEAVAASVRGTDVERTPAAGPRGLERTTWYVDEDAAAHL